MKPRHEPSLDAGPPDPDADAMARARDGDVEAFASLYDRLAPAVMGFLWRLTTDRAAAEDLTQETFLRAWRAAPRWRPTARVRTWLFRIAWRLAANRAARRRHRRAREVAQAVAASEAPDPAARLHRQDEAARLRAALGALSPRLRVAFVLVRLEGLPYAEAARVAAIRLGTLKSRLAAAEARLRRLLAEADGRADRPPTP